MFLPLNRRDMEKRGWDELDFILITPDAYVDHPSFAMALLSRFIESFGYRVGIIPQPRWQDPESFLQLGIPRIAFGISGGNADSLVLNYTPSLKRRKTDSYCDRGDPYFPGSRPSVKSRIRPDRTVIVYSNQLKKACRSRPVIIGGIEASLRRFAHFDYWSGKIRRSILLDSRADILIYGMGEYPLLKVLRYLESGSEIQNMHIPQTAIIKSQISGIKGIAEIPSYFEVLGDKHKFAEAFSEIYNKSEIQPLAQKQDTRYLVSFPPMQITNKQLNSIYELPFERDPHPFYESIPAFDMIKDSITILRGCYGSCSFCSIAFHQGKRIISRSIESITGEIEKLSGKAYFQGDISDLGGPCPNMYHSRCSVSGCNDRSCLSEGKLCRNMKPGTEEMLKLLKKVKSLPRVKRVMISSGLRVEEEILPEGLLDHIINRLNAGQLKIAPESGSGRILKLMNKTPLESFERFLDSFYSLKAKSRSRIRLYPYFIAGHPGEDKDSLEETMDFISRHRLISNNCQQFTPTPMTLATAIYYLGFHPFTGEKIHVEKNQKRLEDWKKRIVNP